MNFLVAEEKTGDAHRTKFTRKQTKIRIVNLIGNLIFPVNLF